MYCRRLGCLVYYYYCMALLLLVRRSRRLSWAFSSAAYRRRYTNNIIIIHTTRSWMTILLTFHTYNTYLPNGDAVSYALYVYIFDWLIDRRRIIIPYRQNVYNIVPTILLLYTMYDGVYTGEPWSFATHARLTFHYYYFFFQDRVGNKCMRKKIIR